MYAESSYLQMSVNAIFYNNKICKYRSAAIYVTLSVCRNKLTERWQLTAKLNVMKTIDNNLTITHL